jgi:opacity protein-like surface antigen
MLILQAGPIQRTPSYGPATVYGIEALAGIDVAITPQIGVRVVLEYSRIHFSFDGKGQMTTTRDNDVTTQDVNGATDRWLGVAAMVGLAY